ncbi:MAG: sugar transferase [Butyrivibrio sp.]|nr:sugar transferase [Acetatifactor muris]MCM1558911.1 sugar transferase [Butyrivibrio sp.]
MDLGLEIIDTGCEDNMIQKQNDCSVKAYDYDRLPVFQQVRIADLIAADNLAVVNKGQEEVTPPKTIYTAVIKRILDIVISLIAIILTAPINVILLIGTALDVGRPLIFSQERMGKEGRVFTLYKFRNMTDEKDEKGILLPSYERTTKWGAFVRKTSLDEFLNFWSVLKGDMSIIGPRPLPVIYAGRFNVYHASRQNVRPGLDCPLHDKKMGYMTWQNRLDNDVWYVENVSFRTDCKMIFLLLNEVFAGKEKEGRARGGSEGTFMGYDKEGNVMNSYEIPSRYYEEVLNGHNLNRVDLGKAI